CNELSTQVSPEGIGFHRIPIGSDYAIIRVFKPSCSDSASENLFRQEKLVMNQQTRRIFVRSGLIAGASVLGGVMLSRATAKEKSDEKEEEVSPAEDLMREHGVLKRVLLIYGEAIRRIDEKEDLSPDALLESARIIRSIIEDYHEKLEEDFLFPRF